MATEIMSANAQLSAAKREIAGIQKRLADLKESEKPPKPLIINGAFALGTGNLNPPDPRRAPTPPAEEKLKFYQIFGQTSLEEILSGIKVIRIMDLELEKRKMSPTGEDRDQDEIMAWSMHAYTLALQNPNRREYTIMDGYKTLVGVYHRDQQMWDELIRQDDARLQRLLST